MVRPIKVAVVRDDPRLFASLRAYALRVPDLQVRETTVAGLLNMAEPRPDVVVVEVARRDGADPIGDVRKLCRAGHRVLALSASNDPYLSAALLSTGAYLLFGRKQTVTAIVAAIRASGPGQVRHARAANGSVAVARNAAAALPDAGGVATSADAPGSRPARPQLSARERSVLLAYTSGMTLDAVAERVGIRPSTAKTYLERVKAKYRQIGRPAYTKLELAQRAREDGSPGL